MLKWTELATDEENLLQQLERAAREKKIPLNSVFELTPRCSLKCEMCYVRMNASQLPGQGRELSAEEWIDLGRQAAEAGTYNLLLTGGEVFIRPDFKQIYEALGDMGFRITIISNATLITPEVAAWLAKRPPYKIKVTLYGASRDTYQKVCGVADGYDRALSGIASLLAVGIRPAIQATVIHGNEDDAFEIASYAAQNGLYFAWDCLMFKARASVESVVEQVRLSPQESAAFTQAMKKHLETLYAAQGGRAEESGEENTKITGQDLRHVVDEGNSLPIRCGLGSSTMCITWDGKMSPCEITGFPSAFPLQQGLKRAWDDLVGQCASIRVPSECRDCQYKKYCALCVCAFAAETGSYNQPGKFYCEYARCTYCLNEETHGKN